MHLGFGLKPKILDNLIKSIQLIDPDIIVITGDLIEGNIFKLLPILKPFKDLSTYYPIYMVIGNHDFEYNHPDDVISSFSSLGIEVLMNISIFIGSQSRGFNLAGISDPISKSRNLPSKYHPNIEKTLKNCNKSLPTILLSHRPILSYC